MSAAVPPHTINRRALILAAGAILFFVLVPAFVVMTTARAASGNLVKLDASVTLPDHEVLDFSRRAQRAFCWVEIARDTPTVDMENIARKIVSSKYKGEQAFSIYFLFDPGPGSGRHKTARVDAADAVISWTALRGFKRIR